MILFYVLISGFSPAVFKQSDTTILKTLVVKVGTMNDQVITDWLTYSIDIKKEKLIDCFLLKAGMTRFKLAASLPELKNLCPELSPSLVNMCQTAKF